MMSSRQSCRDYQIAHPRPKIKFCWARGRSMQQAKRKHMVLWKQRKVNPHSLYMWIYSGASVGQWGERNGPMEKTMTCSPIENLSSRGTYIWANSSSSSSSSRNKNFDQWEKKSRSFIRLPLFRSVCCRHAPLFQLERAYSEGSSPPTGHGIQPFIKPRNNIKKFKIGLWERRVGTLWIMNSLESRRLYFSIFCWRGLVYSGHFVMIMYPHSLLKSENFGQKNPRKVPTLWTLPTFDRGWCWKKENQWRLKAIRRGRYWGEKIDDRLEAIV